MIGFTKSVINPDSVTGSVFNPVAHMADLALGADVKAPMEDIIFVVQYMPRGRGLSQEEDVMGAGFAFRSVGRLAKSSFC